MSGLEPVGLENEQVEFSTKAKNFFQNSGKKFVSFWKNPTTIYILKRILSSFVTLFLVATVVFLLLRFIPKENYVDTNALQKIPTDKGKELYRQAIFREYGLDKPLLQGLWNFWLDIIPIIPRRHCLEHAFTDETFTNMICKPEANKVYLFYLGKSARYERGKTVMEVMSHRMPISFVISLISTFFTYILAYPLGVMMAKNKGKLVDKIGNGFIILNLAIPSLVFYFIIWIIFGSIFGGAYSPAEQNYEALIAPILAMTILAIPGQAMWVRRFMVDEGDADYVKFARSKGLSENRIMFTHVFRNAMVPLVRNLPAAFVGSIIGSYYAEMVWNIPGTGRLMIRAMNVQTPDNELVQGLVIIYSAISMISFLLGDIATIFADPRIKLMKK